MTAVPPLLQAPWSGRRFADGRRLVAVMSMRGGGVSAGEFGSLNLRDPALAGAEADAPAAVAENRRRFAQALGARPVWLRQVHGTAVLRLQPETADGATADAAVSTVAGLACAVQVADCLPVLLAAPEGRGVAAAHAGWRGLSDGVLEATVQALCEAGACAPSDLSAWMGACIGPAAFEVGAEVLRAFGRDPADPSPRHFRYRPRSDGQARWLADLPALAAERLRALGVADLSAAGACTVGEPERFYSYRRDGRTGRMAAAVAVLPAGR